MDARYLDLAQVLLTHSVQLKKGENLFIDAHEIPEEMVIALIRKARELGGVPFVDLHQSRVTRELLAGATVEQYAQMNQFNLAKVKKMQTYIGLRGSHNIFESSNVPSEKMTLAMKELRPWFNWRVQKTRWVVLRWPHPAMAQQAQMSTEAFEDFYFRVCTLDYSRMVPGMKALKKWMDKTDKVEIKSPGTELHFSIKGLEAIPCGGTHNIPDGEVFTAPVRDSVEGVITYNTPTVYQGEAFDHVSLEFSKGKIVKATCSGNEAKLNSILDSDIGARYIGEFAIGFNPYIMEPMRDILFDEKIAGSFHFTPGQAYEGVADNRNRSQVHWDLISIQRPEYGGGEIYFDGKLIRKDGMFLPKDLQKLNPEFLTGKDD
jgi:aminopeptidase